MDETKEPQLRISQIFLAVAHFQHRKDALQLPTTTAVEVPLAIKATAVGNEDGSGGLISLEVKSDDEQDPIYRFQVEMIALVEAEVPNPNLPVKEYLTKMGPTMLFPFVRESLAAITGRGRFGALWLKPINLVAALKLETQTADTAAGAAEGQDSPQ